MGWARQSGEVAARQTTNISLHLLLSSGTPCLGFLLKPPRFRRLLRATWSSTGTSATIASFWAEAYSFSRFTVTPRSLRPWKARWTHAMILDFFIAIFPKPTTRHSHPWSRSLGLTCPSSSPFRTVICRCLGRGNFCWDTLCCCCWICCTVLSFLSACMPSSAGVCACVYEACARPLSAVPRPRMPDPCRSLSAIQSTWAPISPIGWCAERVVLNLAFVHATARALSARRRCETDNCKGARRGSAQQLPSATGSGLLSARNPTDLRWWSANPFRGVSRTLIPIAYKGTTF